MEAPRRGREGAPPAPVPAVQIPAPTRRQKRSGVQAFVWRWRGQRRRPRQVSQVWRAVYRDTEDAVDAVWLGIEPGRSVGTESSGRADFRSSSSSSSNAAFHSKQPAHYRGSASAPPTPPTLPTSPAATSHTPPVIDRCAIPSWPRARAPPTVVWRLPAPAGASAPRRGGLRGERAAFQQTKRPSTSTRRL